jgi:hypothetical protein
MKNDYTALDAAILKAIGNGSRTNFTALQGGEVGMHAEKIALAHAGILPQCPA